MTNNLFDALQQFRARDLERLTTFWLWADTVCINQADLAERGQQLAIMHRIFRKAFTVRIWLGKCLSALQEGREDQLAARGMAVLAAWEV